MFEDLTQLSNKNIADSTRRAMDDITAAVKSTSVQSIVVDSKAMKKDAAIKWVKDHDFKHDKVDEPEAGTSYRFRQFDPGDCQEGSLRTIELTEGVKAVICRRKT